MRPFLSRTLHSVRLCTTLVGTVVGAGFISGAELVRFFPARGFFVPVALSALLYFGCFWLLYRIGARCGGFDGALASLFGRAAPLFRIALLAASLVMCGSMFAGLNAAAQEGFGWDGPFPLAALLAAALLFLFSGRGMKAVYAVNLALVPVILAFVASRFVPPPAPLVGESAEAFGTLCLLLAYVCMNAFLAAPVICDAGASGGGGGAGCAAAAALIGFSACAVLSAVARAGEGALSAQMPFLYAVGAHTAAGSLFSAVCVCGILTTLFSSFYPLQRCAQRGRHAALWRAALVAGAFLLSLGGLRPLVRFVYPAVGAAGIAFLAVCAWRSRLTFPSFSDQQLLRERDERVHARRQHAQDNGRRHHQV